MFRKKKKSRIIRSHKKSENKISHDTLYVSGTSDRLLFGIVAGLTFFGVLMIASAGIVYADVRFDDPYFFFKRQIIGVTLGFIAMIVLSKVDYHIFRRWAFWIFVGSIGLLVLALLPNVGSEAYGASRWISVGPISFQPSEAMKLAVILYISAWCAGKGKKIITDIKEGLMSFICILGFACILVLMQPDVGTTGMIVFIALLIFYLAGARMVHVISIVGGGFVSLVILVLIAPYRMARFTAFLNPEADPQGTGYQIQQALIAIGSGGVFGLGLGHSNQKGLYLPEPVGDSIYAIIAEELGFIGAVALLVIFFLFAWRGMKISTVAPDVFGKLIAGGITVWVVGQALLNIAAITALVPLTGIPLPFISYGGTSIVFTLASVGILLNISKQSKE
ncbi:MAG: putative lipid II flippase FtsW [Candidatus Moraniibacteriota bacterium]|nr:MAG: putative lipid II flippase FtsW [Candidatus Moranbacteria bacterium]